MGEENSKHAIPYNDGTGDGGKAERYAPTETWDAKASEAWGWLTDTGCAADKENKNRFLLAEKRRMCALLRATAETIRSRSAHNGEYRERTGCLATNAEVFRFVAAFASEHSRFRELCYWMRRAWRMAGASESDAWRTAHPHWLYNDSCLQWTNALGTYPGRSALDTRKRGHAGSRGLRPSLSECVRI